MSDEIEEGEAGQVPEFGSALDHSSEGRNMNECMDALDEMLEYDPNTSTDYCQWMSLPNGEFRPVGTTTKELPSDFYRLSAPNGNITFTRQGLSVDQWLEFPKSLTEKILTEISEFWSKGDLFESYGFLHKRGYLFYGPQGSGKSILVQQILNNLLKKENGIVLDGSAYPKLLVDAISILRSIEPERKIICLFEDIDAIIGHYGEADLLAFLDGESNTNHVLSIATTNYPEKLDDRLVKRPRRFDRVILIGMPDPTIREFYFREKLKITDDELKKFVKATKGFSFASMAELVISIKCFDKSFEEAIEILKDLQNKKKSSGDTEDKVGFLSE